MTACRLVRYVDMTNASDGMSHAFGPGDVLPEWADEALTPSARAYLCAGGDPVKSVEIPAPVVPEEAHEDDAPVVRPQGNASRAAWIEYASALGVVVPSDATRKEIAALVDGREA